MLWGALHHGRSAHPALADPRRLVPLRRPLPPTPSLNPRTEYDPAGTPHAASHGQRTKVTDAGGPRLAVYDSTPGASACSYAASRRHSAFTPDSRRSSTRSPDPSTAHSTARPHRAPDGSSAQTHHHHPLAPPAHPLRQTQTGLRRQLPRHRHRPRRRAVQDERDGLAGGAGHASFLLSISAAAWRPSPLGLMNRWPKVWTTSKKRRSWSSRASWSLVTAPRPPVMSRIS